MSKDYASKYATQLILSIDANEYFEQEEWEDLTERINEIHSMVIDTDDEDFIRQLAECLAVLSLIAAGYDGEFPDIAVYERICNSLDWYKENAQSVN